MTFRGPYPSLDPWTYLTAIHYGDSGITKLDFVGHRYMVRGKDQAFSDVLGDDLLLFEGGPAVRDGATQREYRTEEGLDLRDIDGGGDLGIAANMAYLKNKTATPDYRDNPGALNEFLFLDYVVVMEFDWVDVPAIVNEQTSGGFPEGVDIFYWMLAIRNNADNQYFTIGNTEQMQDGTGDIFVSNGSWSWPSAGGSGEGELFGPPVLFIPDGADPEFVPPAPLQGPAGVATDMPGSYQPHTEIFPVPGFWDDNPYTMVPYLAGYDTTGGANPIDGRMVGAVPDDVNNSPAPMNSGALPAPYGRVRVAARVTSSHLYMSVNGGEIRSVAQPALGNVPRLPPMNELETERLSYFPNEGFGAQKDYEVSLEVPGVVRCIWLYRAINNKQRSKYNALNLRTLSTIRPLTPPTAANWKTT